MLLTKHDDDKVVVLTIDRPHRRNALGTELVQSLRAALNELDADPQVHAIVLTGSAPGFCAGSDLKELGTMNLTEMREHEAVTAAVARSISMLSKPVVCSVSGFCFGRRVCAWPRRAISS